jgi:ATP-dependent DNA ligase
MTERYSLLKPYKSLAEVNEQFDPSVLVKDMQGKDELFSIEPKIDGMSVQIHKNGGVVQILADSTDITGNFPRLRDEIEKIYIPSFISHAELVQLDDSGNYLPHEVIVGTAHTKAVYEGDRVVAEAFDVLSFGGGDQRFNSLNQRRVFLRGIFAEGSRLFRPIKNRIVRANLEEVVEAIEELSTDEGVVVKGLSSQYDFEGSKLWWKLKWLHEVDVVVVDKRLVKNSKCTYNYVVGLYNDSGEIQVVGRTMNTNVQADSGDILTVKCDRIIPSEKSFGLYLARVKESRTDKNIPDSFALLRQRSA